MQVVAEGHRLGGCRWVKPGITVAACASAWSSSARCSAAAARPSRPIAGLATHRRKSVATWSLRERAVCSRPAAGPISSREPRLDVHVDVFELRRENGKRPGLDLGIDRVQAAGDGVRVVRLEMMPWRGEHARMRHASRAMSSATAGGRSRSRR